MSTITYKYDQYGNRIPVYTQDNNDNTVISDKGEDIANLNNQSSTKLSTNLVNTTSYLLPNLNSTLNQNNTSATVTTPNNIDYNKGFTAYNLANMKLKDIKNVTNNFGGDPAIFWNGNGLQRANLMDLGSNGKMSRWEARKLRKLARLNLHLNWLNYGILQQAEIDNTQNNENTANGLINLYLSLNSNARTFNWNPSTILLQLTALPNQVEMTTTSAILNSTPLRPDVTLFQNSNTSQNQTNTEPITQLPKVTVTVPPIDWNKRATDAGFANTDSLTKFQKVFGITDDGKYGSDTLKALNGYTVNTAKNIGNYLTYTGANTDNGLETGSYVYNNGMVYKNGKHYGDIDKGVFTKINPSSQAKSSQNNLPSNISGLTWGKTNGTVTSYTRDFGNGLSRTGTYDSSTKKWNKGNYTVNGKNITGIKFKTNDANYKWDGNGIYKTGTQNYRINNGKLLVQNIYPGSQTDNWQDASNGYFYQNGGVLLYQEGGELINMNNKTDLMTEIVNSVKEAFTKDPQGTMQQLSEMMQKNPDGVKLILGMIQAEAELGDEISTSIIKAISGTQTAKMGTKLNYIKSLKNICPEGYEVSYMKAGSKMCPICKRKTELAAKAEQKLVKKHYYGGVTETIDTIKADMMKCGGKTKVKKGEMGLETTEKNKAPKPTYTLTSKGVYKAEQGINSNKIKKNLKPLTPNDTVTINTNGKSKTYSVTPNGEKHGYKSPNGTDFTLNWSNADKRRFDSKYDKANALKKH